MKISYNWLKEYIDIKQSPEKLAALLTKSGSEVKAIDRTAGDSIMDIEITPNRSDCLSYIGIAREDHLLTIDGKRMDCASVYRKVRPIQRDETVNAFSALEEYGEDWQEAVGS